MTGHVSAKIPASVTWALGLTQIIGYGTLYYSFGALAPSMARDLGWSEEWVYGVLSASLLLSGLVAPASGAYADRFGAAKVMAWGSVAAPKPSRSWRKSPVAAPSSASPTSP
jgi:MFS family permease